MAIDTIHRGIGRRLRLVAPLVLVPALLGGCSRQVNCEAEVPWVDTPDLAFTGRVKSTDTVKATFQVENVQLGPEGFLVDVSYPEPGLLNRETEYEVRAIETGGEPEFESSVYCGATRQTNGEPIDTSWLTTMRARLPSTPVVLLAIVVFFVLLVAGGVTGLRLLDQRLRRRYTNEADAADQSGNRS
ncbi:MAG: hypothetical protein JJLCMIEE_02596 [Acidimicrobiales bacterium]|nr:MAG: hypothetical protein EDR02_09555 [Actinomycetota bacterium]MBV6509503.1 hypothetical protein [Acidimicrobiales bacterium]RIK06625.1 MAG: hypothetical protein DCC48_06880 [Acidobacteriota bacterium]